jgi:hypothetical protein
LCANCQADARIETQTLGRDAGRDAGLHPCSQHCLDLVHYIDIFGSPLHRARIALHVHQAHAGATPRRGLQGSGEPQRAHVIDEPGAGIDSLAHDLRLAGIDGQQHATRAQAAHTG